MVVTLTDYLSPILLFSMMRYVMQYHFGQFGSAALVLSPPTSCHLSLLTDRTVGEAGTSLALCSTTQEQLTHWCLINLCSSPKVKMWHHTSQCEENQLYPK